MPGLLSMSSFIGDDGSPRVRFVDGSTASLEDTITAARVLWGRLPA